MKKFNITVPKKYMKDGEEKTQWNRVGTLIYFDADAESSKEEGFILELSMFPETKFGVFEDKPRDEKKIEEEAKKVITEEISSEDVPF